MMCLSERSTCEITETKNEFGWWINETEMLISTPYSKKLKFQNRSSSISEEAEDFNLVQESNISVIPKSEGMEMIYLNESLNSQTENEQSFLENVNIDKSENTYFIANESNQIENQENFIQNFDSKNKERYLTENRGISYIPERLVKSEEYKIISPPFQSAFIHSSTSRQRKLSELIDRTQIGASHLERLLCPSIVDIEYYHSFGSERFSVKNEINNQTDDNFLMADYYYRHLPTFITDMNPSSTDHNHRMSKDLSNRSSGFEKLKSFSLKEKGTNHKFSSEEKDTSGTQSTGWSLDTSSEPVQVPLRLQELSNLFSSSPEMQFWKTGNLVWNRTIEGSLSVKKEELFFEDVEIGFDNPGNLACIIQDQENLFELQSRVERLRVVNENIHKDIGTLKEDFQTVEWKVEDLLEDTSNFRREIQDLKYLDDLLNLLQGELERVTQKSWPFVSGHADPCTEEINLIV